MILPLDVLPALSKNFGKSEKVDGVYPFVVGDLLKIALAAAALPSGWKLLEFGGIAGKKD